MKLLLIVPTYNERENLPTLIEALSQLQTDWHILFVDDQSCDGTLEYLQELNSQKPDKVSLFVRKEDKRGLGLAYRDAFQLVKKGAKLGSHPKSPMASGFDYVLQMDADGQHPVEKIPELITLLEQEGAGLVIASRYSRFFDQAHASFSREILSKLIALYTRYILSLPYNDPSGGFRLWTRRALLAINPDTLESQGYIIQVETLLRAERVGGVKIVELPFTFAPRLRGQSKLSFSIGQEACFKLIRWAFLKHKFNKHEA